MKSPSDELQRRQPVWEALSELFLDTELDSAELRRIAKTLAHSEYTDSELTDILFQEVYPVCIPNMYSFTGIWEGFDVDWLQQQILVNDKMASKRLSVFQLSRGMIHKDWKTVLEMLPEERLVIARETRKP